jgi:hypothetical protein
MGLRRSLRPSTSTCIRLFLLYMMYGGVSEKSEKQSQDGKKQTPKKKQSPKKKQTPKKKQKEKTCPASPREKLQKPPESQDSQDSQESPDESFAAWYQAIKDIKKLKTPSNEQISDSDEGQSDEEVEPIKVRR